MKKLRAFPKLMQQQKKQEVAIPNLFVFCEKKTGVAQFRAASTRDYSCTVERIAGLLAMQCLVRGQNPGDFEIMVPAEGTFVDRLVARAHDLLKEGRAIGCSMSLSERQREVLHSVMDNCANKEIASDLAISEATVKTHVNNLLSKLGVSDRTNAATVAIQRGLVHFK